MPRKSNEQILREQLRTANHPIAWLLFTCAEGREPEPRDIEHATKTAVVGERDSVRAAIRTAARNCLELRRAGHNGRARAHAREVSMGLAEKLGLPHREHGLFDDPVNAMSPRELAEQIPRGNERIAPIKPAA